MEFDRFVLAASTADLADVPGARPYADAVELRLDLAESPLDQLASYEGTLPVIATNRIETEGGEAPATPERLDILEAAVADPAVEAVDVELAAVTAGVASRVVDAARDRDVRVIVSVHDFDGTPDEEAMTASLRSAVESGDLGKLAVAATDPGDVLSLMTVTWELSQAGMPVATMAMGPAGRHSRAIAPLYGSRLGYAPVSPRGATAPGQYDLEALRDLIDALGVS